MKSTLQNLLNISPDSIEYMTKEGVIVTLQSIKKLETASQEIWQMFQNLDTEERPNFTLQLIRNYANGSVKTAFDEFNKSIQILAQRASFFSSIPLSMSDKEAQKLLSKLQGPAQFYLEYQNQKHNLDSLTELLIHRMESLDQESFFQSPNKI